MTDQSWAAKEMRRVEAEIATWPKWMLAGIKSIAKKGVAMAKPEITAEQTKALGEILAENLGAHMQSGWSSDTVLGTDWGTPGCIYVWVKHGPHIPAIRYEISRDGKVTKGE